MSENDGPGPDGARGYTAQEGLAAVLGGENIEKMNKREGARTPEQMKEYLLHGKDPEPYSEAARKAGGKILRAMMKNKPWEHVCDGMDLTGFMYGWAHNAAKYALEKPTGGNPALMTVEVKG